MLCHIPFNTTFHHLDGSIPSMRCVEQFATIEETIPSITEAIVGEDGHTALLSRWRKTMVVSLVVRLELQTNPPNKYSVSCHSDCHGYLIDGSKK